MTEKTRILLFIFGTAFLVTMGITAPLLGVISYYVWSLDLKTILLQEGAAILICFILVVILGIFLGIFYWWNELREAIEEAIEESDEKEEDEGEDPWDDAPVKFTVYDHYEKK